MHLYFLGTDRANCKWEPVLLNQYIVGMNFLNINGLSRQQCLDTCWAKTSCQGVNFKKAGTNVGSCDLNLVTSNVVTPQADINWDMYNLRCKSLMNP